MSNLLLHAIPAFLSSLWLERVWTSAREQWRSRQRKQRHVGQLGPSVIFGVFLGSYCNSQIHKWAHTAKPPA